MPCLTPYRGDTSQMLLFKIASCLEASGGGGGVLSFNGRTGDVILSLADVAAVADGRYVLKSGDTMTGALAMPAGSAALPSNTFSGDTNTGMYSPGADSVGFSTGGTLRLTVSSTAVTSTVPILLPDGTAALPANTFSSDTDTGLFRIGANNFGLSAGGALTLGVATTGVNMTSGLAYQYNSMNVIRAQTALVNYFFGPSGNLTMTGTGNSTLGVNALLNNTTGINNLALGSSALQLNTTGDNNIAVGTNSLFFNTSGISNSALGASSLLNNGTGSNNTGMGARALMATTTGGNNSAVGDSTLLSNTTGISNSALGASGLINLTTGSNNTAVGYATGLGISTGSNNTILGANVSGLAAALSSNIILADGAGVIRIQVDSAGVVSIPIALTLGTAAPLSMTSGANQRAGDAVLVGGTVTVANTTVTANTRVFLTRRVTGGTIGFAVTYTIIAATSFTITSDNVLDTSTYSYLLIEVP